MQPPRQAKAFSKEKAHVSLFDHLRGVTKKVERVDVVIRGYSSMAEHSALTRSMQVRLLLPLPETFQQEPLMKEAYFDPALQKHLERRALIHKWQHRRNLIKKYRVLIASSAASVSMVAALFFWKIYPLI